MGTDAAVGREDHGRVASTSSSPTSSASASEPDKAEYGGALTCAALATGMKCLPQNKIHLARGNVLHDWHAEILALRAFNRFLVDECAELAANGTTSMGQWVRWRRKGEEKVERQQPFQLQEDVGIHMYCSEAPCGDASMELTMREQEDATPWTTSVPVVENGMQELLGRGHFDQLGVVRRKPARPDAPPTLSKSCSDKLALKQCTGLLSGLMSRLVWPGNVYLSSLVLPKEQVVPEAVERAFGWTGRMKGVVGGDSETWRRGGYSFRPFEVEGTKREFEFSKRSSSGASELRTPAATSPGWVGPSNLSALATPRRQEILINGVLQGRKQSDPKGASCVSRKSMWRAVVDVTLVAGLPALAEGLRKRTYGGLKGGGELEAREQVKKEVRTLALKGWKRNVEDEEWSLDTG